MPKPDAFRQSYVTFRNTPYQFTDSAVLETSSHGGVLRRGQTVWTREVYSPQARPRQANAFVDGLGVVSVDPRWLVPAESLAPAAQ